jgi:hypothetical protein
LPYLLLTAALEIEKTNFLQVVDFQQLFTARQKMASMANNFGNLMGKERRWQPAAFP